MRRIGVFGSELSLLLDFSPIEKIYIRCFGSLSKYTVQRYLQFKYFPIKFFRKRKIRHKKILDFGCAFGGFGFMAARHLKSAEVILHDIDPEAETRCKHIIERGKYANVRFLRKEQLEKENDFSFTILTDVLEHIEDDYKVLKEIYERTVAGGYLYVRVPFYKGGHLSEGDLYHGHVRTGYKVEEIQNLLEQAGFHSLMRPQYRPTNSRFLLSKLETLYFKLIKLPDSPFLNFKTFKRLSFGKRASLAFLWPFYRFILELEIIVEGIPAKSIMLLAQK